jgi:hypothetical protein
MGIVPDDKNWTWVLEEVCTDCGYDARSVDVGRMAEHIRGNADAWPALLAHLHATLRPADDQWSALEYGCHVRDVFRLFDERLRLMLETDAPRFANWDQDVTAIEDRYDRQDPTVVADELVAAGHAHAARWETVRPDQWERTGHRSDGAVFTVDSFARYLLHDPVHHLDDVARGNLMLADGALD